MATDDDEMPLSAYAPVRVTIEDTNNHAPVFDAENYTAVVETASSNEPVLLQMV